MQTRKNRKNDEESYEKVCVKNADNFEEANGSGAQIELRPEEERDPVRYGEPTREDQNGGDGLGLATAQCKDQVGRSRIHHLRRVYLTGTINRFLHQFY